MLQRRNEFLMPSYMTSLSSQVVRLNEEKDVHAERGARRAVAARGLVISATAGVCVMVTAMETNYL